MLANVCHMAVSAKLPACPGCSTVFNGLYMEAGLVF